jgi:hypothetical protein
MCCCCCWPGATLWKYLSGHRKNSVSPPPAPPLSGNNRVGGAWRSLGIPLPSSQWLLYLGLMSTIIPQSRPLSIELHCYLLCKYFTGSIKWIYMSSAPFLNHFFIPWKCSKFGCVSWSLEWISEISLYVRLLVWASQRWLKSQAIRNAFQSERLENASRYAGLASAAYVDWNMLLLCWWGNCDIYGAVV